MADDTPKPITFDDLERLQINSANELFWDGKRVETKGRLDLSRWQKFWAVIATIAAVLGGIATAVNSGTQFTCKEWLVFCGHSDLRTGALIAPPLPKQPVAPAAKAQPVQE